MSLCGVPRAVRATRSKPECDIRATEMSVTNVISITLICICKAERWLESLSLLHQMPIQRQAAMPTLCQTGECPGLSAQ